MRPQHRSLEPGASRVERAAETLREVSWLKALGIRARGVANPLCEAWLGIDTRATGPPDPSSDGRFGDAYGYEPADYLWLYSAMAPYTPTPEDVVVDIGCGMGRVLCLYARYPVRKCVGIEHDPELAAIARRNAGRLRGRRAPVEIRIEDAALAEYGEGTFFWLYNPFGPATLRGVLARIRQSVTENPRPLRFIYLNPEHDAEFARQGWLRHSGRRHFLLYRYGFASYWRYDP